MRIGVDLMGGDSSPQALFEAVLQTAQRLDVSYCLIAIATASIIAELQLVHALFLSQKNHALIEFQLALDVITMQDEPLSAIVLKKKSSLVVGIRLLKKEQIHAFVSAGNTGALVACATLNLARLPGIKRPALLVVLPTLKGSVAVLDVGGSVSCTAQHLIQFARMGTVYQRCSEGMEKPRLGLLNIGVESEKGTSVLRKAYRFLKNGSEIAFHMNFIGNVEGREVFQGEVDVLVAEGFSGNIFLKTAEGVSAFVFERIAKALQELDSSITLEKLESLKNQLHYSEYPGAVICGVEGVVIKCHGDSSSQAMFNGIQGAIALVHKKLIPQMKQELGRGRV